MTKVATIDTRRFFALLLIAAMLMAMIPIGVAMLPSGVLASDNAADNEASVEGGFALNNGAPVVNSVALYEHDDATTASAMDPTVEYIVQVSVTDTNTLADLDSLYVTVYYDEDGTFNVGQVPGSGSAQDGAILKWDALDTWTIDDGSSTWTIETDSVDPADLAAQNTFTFKFHFKPGEVAKESVHDTDGDAEWMIYAVATDLSTATANARQETREMNWYGKISVIVVGGGPVAFGTLSLADADQVCSNSVTATYTSNGPFDESVKADDVWGGSSMHAHLDTDDSPTNGKISLEADDDTSLTDAVVVLSSDFTAIDTSDTITTESGTAVNMKLWITIASSGIENESFTGTIFYQISNGS